MKIGNLLGLFMIHKESSAKYIDNIKIIQEVEIQLFAQPLSSFVVNLGRLHGLKIAWELIQSHYREPNLNLENAAIATGISKNHLNVLLRQATNLTFHQILIRYRLLMAINMLKIKNINLLVVALENGFGSLNAFNRDFRKHMGITPRMFRDNYPQDKR